ncbi:diversity-generating retroelement protein Avd [Candidatus Saccharibacteria bacterium]|nr:diversity-generating retroelement protein Avd [Candidatus Saccharibacteria bacterium]
MKPDFIIYTRMLEVQQWIFDKVNTFPKKQRFVLGQQIETSALACLRLIIQANNLKNPEKTLLKLDDLNTELEVLRGLLRIGFEMKFLSAKSLGHITKRIDEVGKMTGGWIKTARDKRLPTIRAVEVEQ